jgi:hypothetical protein
MISIPGRKMVAQSFRAGDRVLVTTDEGELPGVIHREVAHGIYLVDVPNECPQWLVSAEELRRDPED